MDAARSDHFSCYGYDKLTTPYIDEIAKKGVVFHNHFSNSTCTETSIPQLFFSRYLATPTLFQADAWRWGIRQYATDTIFKQGDAQQVFLSDLLSDKGYETVLFHNHQWFVKQSSIVKHFDASFYEERDTNVVSASIDWIRENRNTKFFAYCHIMSPHQPYPYYRGKFLSKAITPNEISKTLKKIDMGATNKKDLIQRQLQIIHGLYDSKLNHTDRHIGRLYNELEKLGLAQNTLFIITSDHGENLGEHEKLFHGGPPWESVIKIPLISVCPRFIPAGKKVYCLTESVDVMPTIVDVLKLDFPPRKTMDGVGLFNLIDNPDLKKEAVFPAEAIRTEEFKYFMGHLYNVKDDPHETENIIEQQPRLAEELKKRLHKAMRPYEDRYEKTQRSSLPPSEPFYYSVLEFEIEPKSEYVTSPIGSNPAKPWVLNIDWGGEEYGLFCIPANGIPERISLSAPLPNGRYKMYALLKTWGKVPKTAQEIGFRFRFDGESPFIYPPAIRLVRKYRNNVFFYVEFSEVYVSTEEVSVQISFTPPNKNTYMIHHIKFEPLGRKKRKGVEYDSDQEFRQKIEKLKSLGYM